MESQPNMDDVKISRDSLSEYLRKRYPNRPIVFDTCPDMLDGLLAELCTGRFDTIGQLDNTLARTEKAAELFEMDNPPDIGLADNRYSVIGIVKLSMRLLDDDFFILETQFSIGICATNFKNTGSIYFLIKVMHNQM